ncbi:prolyl aminopeptidase [Thiomicrorhabdus lithotrophica]|uniref:Proline iminopeptidase n=1 Tax=Thiomicrorhabdus lithotrophica TaxID=2949997 RepID=A0ABY8CEN8_9GAMM|nr:prolyl aminopeptidase [Thiomicrorhabdus lithotrophica]WEJ62878.1 prolyl aminopeptidase [Thiomicrorhabdus lithotrophica]
MHKQYLYAPIEPYVQHSLQVDSTHTLHIEECGNPLGIPVLFIHGGPGGGYSPVHRQFFNPSDYRIILFDQRGCGKSRPHACLTNNTTAHLIEDIEKIRRHLEVDKWLLFGGSWGSTLSLLYAQTYPERATGLILRGIFLCRKQDVNWFYQNGANQFYPEYWADFIAPVEPKKRSNMIAAYHELLTSDNEVARMRAAEAWSVWEGRTSNLKTDPDTVNHFGEPFHALAMARIECHYFQHEAFIETNQILNNTPAIADLPVSIVHGRYDLVCPVNQAFELHEALPNSKLIICNNSGHSAMEAEIAKALVDATDLFAEQLS